PAFESLTQVTALGRGCTIRIFLSDLFKTCSGANLLQQVLGLGLGGSDLLLVITGLFGGNQNFAKLYLLLAFHIRLVLVVKLLLFFFGDVDMSADLALNDLLRDDFG